MKKYVSHLFFLVPVLLAIPAILPLFHAGWFPIHDDAQVQRVYEMTMSLRGGMFPVRWVPDLGFGYGYPIFNFYAPVAYYIGALFTFITQNSLIGTKIMIGLSVLTSGVTMYLLGKRVWGTAGGFLSSTFYIFAPYHALDIYVRGDMAEAMAYAFLPLIFLGIYEIYTRRPVRGVLIGSIGYALVISSHNLTAMMVTPFILLILITLSIISIRNKDVKLIRSYCVLILLGLGLSAWYWLPVFAEMHYTNVLSQVGGGADFRDHFVCLGQLWNSLWGFGGSTKGCVDGLSFRIGKLHVLGAVASLIVAFLIFRKQRERAWIICLLLVMALVSVFLLLPQSQFIWEAIKPMAFLQYPWRFLLPLSFFVSLAIGGIVSIIPKRFTSASYIFVACLVLGSGIIYQKLFIPQAYIPRDVSYFTSDENLQFATSQISDEYMPPHFIIPKTYNEVNGESTTVFGTTKKWVTEKNTVRYERYSIILSRSERIHFDTAYFPTWHFFVDGREVPILPTNTGINATIPAGSHTLELVFRQTNLEKLANVLSAVCACLMLYAIINSRYGRHKKTS